jgi:hypothetical protein
MAHPTEDVLRADIHDAMVCAQSMGDTDPKANIEFCVLFLMSRHPELGPSAALGALLRFSLENQPVVPGAVASSASSPPAAQQAKGSLPSADVRPVEYSKAAQRFREAERGETKSTGVSESDEHAIRTLIKNHSEAVCWTPDTPPNWDKFSAHFLPGASLFPAARPAQIRTSEIFIKQLKRLAAGTLDTFEEHTLGMQILGFGNIAVVLAASEMLENGSETNHDISAYLLLKTEGEWLIAAHAWDKANEELPVPHELRSAVV